MSWVISCLASQPASKNHQSQLSLGNRLPPCWTPTWHPAGDHGRLLKRIYLGNLGCTIFWRVSVPAVSVLLDGTISQGGPALRIVNREACFASVGNSFHIPLRARNITRCLL